MAIRSQEERVFNGWKKERQQRCKFEQHVHLLGALEHVLLTKFACMGKPSEEDKRNAY